MAISTQPCSNPACKLDAFRTSKTGLCRRCEDNWRKKRLPVAGFYSSLDLQAIGKAWLVDQRFTKSDTTAILRVLRGTRHPVGPWDQRPSRSCSSWT